MLYATLRTRDSTTGLDQDPYLCYHSLWAALVSAVINDDYLTKVHIWALSLISVIFAYGSSIYIPPGTCDNFA
jgi:hypothetical protein